MRSACWEAKIQKAYRAHNWEGGISKSAAHTLTTTPSTTGDSLPKGIQELEWKLQPTLQPTLPVTPATPAENDTQKVLQELVQQIAALLLHP